MAVYVVTWDLNKEKPNYNAARTAFINHLETYSNKKDPDLDSVRFISTDDTASEVSVYLQLKLDEDDTLFVSRLRKGERAGRLKKSVWTWINEQEGS